MDGWIIYVVFEKLLYIEVRTVGQNKPREKDGWNIHAFHVVFHVVLHVLWFYFTKIHWNPPPPIPQKKIKLNFDLFLQKWNYEWCSLKLINQVLSKHEKYWMQIIL